MAKKPQSEIDEGNVTEQDGTLFLKCNRPLSFTEYQNVVAKIQMEEERTGRKIIIVPFYTDVVKS